MVVKSLRLRNRMDPLESLNKTLFSTAYSRTGYVPRFLRNTGSSWHGIYIIRRRHVVTISVPSARVLSVTKSVTPIKHLNRMCSLTYIHHINKSFQMSISSAIGILRFGRRG